MACKQRVDSRRQLDRRLEEELAKAQRCDTPLSILLMDIDQFKQINDTLGHPAGDCVLSCLGKLINHTMRVPDVAARYGGGEIVVIAPNSPISQATSLAERLRLQIQSQPIALPREQETPDVVCVAGCTEETKYFHNLVEAANQALYRTKTGDRNRVSA